LRRHGFTLKQDFSFITTGGQIGGAHPTECVGAPIQKVVLRQATFERQRERIKALRRRAQAIGARRQAERSRAAERSQGNAPEDKPTRSSVYRC
jgi:hypothetical protein